MCSQGWETLPPFSSPQKTHSIIFLSWMSALSLLKRALSSGTISQELSRKTQDTHNSLLNSTTSSYSVLSHRPFSFSDSYLVPTRLFIPYIQKENSLISWFVVVPFHPLHYPDSQALFTCNPSLLLHFPFLRLSMSISFCTPLLYSTSNPALLELRRWIYT